MHHINIALSTTLMTRTLNLLLLLTLLVIVLVFPISRITTASSPQVTNDASSYNLKGKELYRAGDFAGAIVAFNQAIKLRQDYAEAFLNLGDSYFQLMAYEKALEAYKKAIRYQPNMATAHNNLGTAYYKLGQHKKAVEPYKEAIRLNPDAKRTYYNLGATYLELGNQPAALEQYKILETRDPQLAKELHILIYRPMALVFGNTGARLRVSVTDAQGVSLGDLTQNDFQVTEDGVAQTISSFSKEQSPLVYCLALDTSGSMRPVFELAIGVSKSLVQASLPTDEVLLVRFVSSDKIETVQEFMSDKIILTRSIDSLYLEGGQSAVLDAAYLSAQRVAQHKFEDRILRRMIILITDGEDRASYYSMDELLKLLRKVDVQVFAIGLNKDNKQNAPLNENRPKSRTQLLTTLASETGGRVFFPRSVTELEIAVNEMMHLIRTQYIIEYQPTNTNLQPTYRRVSVELVPKSGRENAQVHARAGYLIAGNNF